MGREFFEVPYKSKLQIRQYTKYVRHKLKIKGEYVDVVRLVEVQFPHFIPNYRFRVVNDEDIDVNMRGVSACTEVKDGKITMYVLERVYDEALEDRGRARFTLAHEGGHVLMHCTGDITLNRIECPDKLRIPIENERNPEWQADQFAAELLAPFDMIQGMTKNEIMWKFKVSNTCALNRISTK